MASEEIKLVGVFRDEITPKLKKLNKEINATTKNFGKMRQKLQPIATDFRKIGDAIEKVNRGFNAQNAELKEASMTMSKYRTQVRRTASEQKKLKPMQGGARGRGMPMGGGRGGGGIGFGGMLGANIAGSFITDAIYRGFEMGVKLMMAPFKALGAAIKDGIEDEMSDIQSSGGMYALDKKSAPGERIFANFIQARNFQEELNRELAMSAASLPGATSDYVQSAKQLTDTVFGTFAKGGEAFAGLAGTLGGKEGATDKENITTVLKKFTEQSVLLSQGSKGGMPLGMLLEQLISQENVNIQSYKKRYKQLRSNPLLANMLEDAQESINASGAMTADRFKAVMAALDNALPQEVVNSMRRSVAGVSEAIRSGLLDQEVGLLGLRRPLQKSIAAINEFGQYIDEEGNVVMTAAEAAKEQTTIFKMFRDIIAGFGLPISEIVGILPEVFDPLNGMANALGEMRQASIAFAQNVTKYTNFFKESGFDKAGARGALAGVNKLLYDLGAIGKDEALANTGLLETKDFNPASMVMTLMKQLLNSDFMGQIGEMVGGVVGSVFKVIDQMINGVVGTMEGEGGNKLIQGLSDGFKKAFGKGSFTKTIAKAFEFVARIIAKAFVDHVIPVIVDSFAGLLEGAWEAGIEGKILVIAAAIAGLAGAIGIVTGLFNALATIFSVVKGAMTLLVGAIKVLAPMFSMLGSVLKFIVGGSIKGAFTALGAAVTGILAPIAAISGAIMATVAVFRHMDLILDSFGQAFVALAKTVEAGWYGVMGALLSWVGGLPIVGNEQLRAQGAAMTARSGNAMGEAGAAVGNINANTAESFGRTTSDFEKMGNLFKGRGFVSNETAGVADGGPGVQASAFDFTAVEASLNNFTTSIGNFFTTTFPTAMSDAFTAMTTWLSGLPESIAYSVGFAVGTIEQQWGLFTTWLTTTMPQSLQAGVDAVLGYFSELPAKISGVINQIGAAIQNELTYISTTFTTWLASIASIPELLQVSLSQIATNLIEWAKSLPSKVMGGIGGVFSGIGTAFGAGRKDAKATPQYNGQGSSMSLGSAIATEQKNKPPGSNLVIANSSETVIPAFKGYTPSSIQPAAVPAFSGYTPSSMGGSKEVNIGGITVNVTGGGDPQETAELVAQEIVAAIQKSTYNELFTS